MQNMTHTYTQSNDIVLSANSISKTFIVNEKQINALINLSLEIEKGKMTALVGPDGAGKSTFLRLVAGLLNPTQGTFVFEGVEYKGNNSYIQSNIAYMPQKFGLYEDLTVQENLNLFADLKSLPKNGREEKYNQLLDMCAMLPFTNRLAGKLSGGMKQKLGLVCTLLSSPKLLLLDEPTVGVDPLSRLELWEIIKNQTEKLGMSLIISTSYLDEAAKCDNVVLLFEGKTLAKGKPSSITSLTNNMSYLAKIPSHTKPRQIQSALFAIPSIIDALPEGDAVRYVHDEVSSKDKFLLDAILKNSEISSVPSTLEDSFMLLLQEHVKEAKQESVQLEEEVLKESFITDAVADTSELETKHGEPIIETKNVSRYFGDFAAVDDVSFSVYKGEVFGLLGPNGAGKTTTFRMLCGLLPASLGSLHVAGVDVRKMQVEARRHIGYVAQKFSLYGTLSTKENLDFFAGAYGLHGKYKKNRIHEVIEEFSLGQYLHMPTQNLPGGYKQRLAMAVGLLHKPSILFLDEATSGADPLARREFWRRISELSENKVTIIVTTHFMEEAEYCDRVLIQDRGKMLTLGTPQEIRQQAQKQINNLIEPNKAITMEQAFISIVEKFRTSTQEPKGGSNAKSK